MVYAGVHRHLLLCAQQYLDYCNPCTNTHARTLILPTSLTGHIFSVLPRSPSGRLPYTKGSQLDEPLQAVATGNLRDLRDWYIYRDYMNSLEYVALRALFTGQATRHQQNSTPLDLLRWGFCNAEWKFKSVWWEPLITLWTRFLPSYFEIPPIQVKLPPWDSGNLLRWGF